MTQARLDMYFLDGIYVVNEKTKMRALLLDCRSTVVSLPIRVSEALYTSDNMCD